MISEPRGIPKDTCKEIQEQINMYGSDGHSHNYNTLKELISFDWSPYGDTCNEFINEVIPKMVALQKEFEEVRIVYFFDN